MAHCAVKYGDTAPALPEECGNGEFHRSFDDRLWLFTRSWRPEGKTWATLMIVHGTVDHSGVYEELGKSLSAKGVAVFASDMRGWGYSDGEPLYVDDIQSFVGDIVADYERIHQPGSPYADVSARFLLGKSIGGLFTAWAAAQYQDKWTGLIGLSGAFQVDEAMKPSTLTLMLVKSLAWLMPKMPLRQLFDPKLIVSDEDALKAWERDPLVSRGKITPGYLTEMFRLQAALPEHLKQLKVPVLLLWGTGDQVVTEAGHQLVLAAAKEGDSGDSQFLRYSKGFHNLLAEPQHKDKVIDDIHLWIKKVSKAF